MILRKIVATTLMSMILLATIGATNANANMYCQREGPEKYYGDYCKGTYLGMLTINSKEAYANGKRFKLEYPPYVKNGRTLVPLIYLSESMECDVYYNKDNGTIYISKDWTTIVMNTGSNIYYTNNVVGEIKDILEVSGDEVFVPLRFVTDVFGMYVKAVYDKHGLTERVVISSEPLNQTA